MSYSHQQALEMLGFYIEAERLVLAGKTIVKNGRTWSREDLSEVRKGRQEWERIVRATSERAKKGPSVAVFE